MWTIRSKCVTLLLLGLAAADSHVAAQCSGLASGTNYKVLIDEVEYVGSSSSRPVVSLDLVQTSVEGALEKVRQGILKTSAQHGEILYLNCTGRHPQEQQFRDDVIRDMIANHAILEFWGSLLPLGGNQNRFEIHYVMFPVGSLSPPRPSEFASTQKVMATLSPQDVTNYLINARADLPAYFTIALGLQAYADRNWGQAVSLLCEARTRLSKPNQQELMRTADQFANKAASELRKNALSSASLLTDAQAKDYCKFATTR